MLKVFKMNDYEWVVSPLSKEETNEWYIKYVDCDAEDQLIEDVEECNIETDGMWLEIEDITKLKEIQRYLRNLLNEKQIENKEQLLEIRKISDKTSIGDVIKHEGMWCEYVSFAEAIKRLNYDDITTPDFIATTEW